MNNVNWIQENTSTTGTGGTLTLAGAVAGFVPFSSRFANGTIVTYQIVDGNNRESGVGKLTNATTLTKETIWEKLESGVLSELPATGLNLTGSAKVSLAGSAEDTHSPGVAYVNAHATEKYLVDAFMAPALTTAAISFANVIFCPLYAVEPAILSGLGINVTALGASSIIRLGLYRQDGKYFRQLRTTGDIDVSTGTGTTGMKTASFTGGNIALRPGMYWTAFCGSGANITVDQVGSGLRHPFAPAKTKFIPSHYLSNGGGAIPLAASYGPFDHNWVNDNAANHPHIVGVMP